MKKRYEAPEDIVNDCLEQLDRDINRLRTALICLFTALFSVAFGLFI